MQDLHSEVQELLQSSQVCCASALAQAWEVLHSQERAVPAPAANLQAQLQEASRLQAQLQEAWHLLPTTCRWPLVRSLQRRLPYRQVEASQVPHKVHEPREVRRKHAPHEVTPGFQAPAEAWATAQALPKVLEVANRHQACRRCPHLQHQKSRDYPAAYCASASPEEWNYAIFLRDPEEQEPVSHQSSSLWILQRHLLHGAAGQESVRG